MTHVADIIDLNHMHTYATKYGLDLEYINTVYNALQIGDVKYVTNPIQFRMPKTVQQVKQSKDKWTGELIQIQVDEDRGAVTWIGIEGINLPAQNVEEPIAKKAGESKLDICRRVYDSNISRQHNIDNFRYHAGCTSAGAATYHQKIKKELAA